MLLLRKIQKWLNERAIFCVCMASLVERKDDSGVVRKAVLIITYQYCTIEHLYSVDIKNQFQSLSSCHNWGVDYRVLIIITGELLMYLKCKWMTFLLKFKLISETCISREVRSLWCHPQIYCLLCKELQYVLMYSHLLGMRPRPSFHEGVELQASDLDFVTKSDYTP
jgi:hypothetical protein